MSGAARTKPALCERINAYIAEVRANSAHFGGEDKINDAIDALVAETREECAVIAEHASPRHTECGNRIAAAIRASGKGDDPDRRRSGQ
jgi:hypothetical protein